jgi:hypothetical protein
MHAIESDAFRPRPRARPCESDFYMRRGTSTRTTTKSLLCNNVWKFTKMTFDFMKFHTSTAWPRASSLIVEETLALCFTRRGGVYPRPQTTAITATGGDKPRPYEFNVVSYECPEVQGSGFRVQRFKSLHR